MSECLSKGCRKLETRCQDCGRVVSTAKFGDKWISINDRVPHHDQRVLVYNFIDGISTGYYERHACSGYYEDDGTYFVVNSGWQTDYHHAPKQGVTHWMQLPEAPNE